MATSVDRLFEKLRVFYDALPEDEQQVLGALLRQSQAEAAEVAGYAVAQRVVIPSQFTGLGFHQKRIARGVEFRHFHDGSLTGTRSGT